MKTYTGDFTKLGHKNFQISDITAPKVFQKALGIVKLAAAISNDQLKLLKSTHAKAIQKAALEFAELKYDSQFTLDVFQAGAGTSYNMNANEVIASRANEIAKTKEIHPNNHVNMAQSTNDVIPTTTRVAILLITPELTQEAKRLESELTKIARKHKKLVKTGRTHLQDAVPISFAQEIDSFVQAIKKSREFIEQEAKKLQIISIGGTAVGTGINTDPKYRTTVVKNLSKITKINFKSAKNLTEIANNMNAFLNYSAALRSLSINLHNLSNNLKLMNMGPKAGLSEINLPEVQPGSSIMPGKINPSICECMDMICFQVLGNDKVIEVACQKSHFELNTTCPIIMHNLVQSVQILTSGMKMLREKAIKGLTVNKKRIESLYEQSLVTATALSPYIGYKTTADVVKKALEKDITIKEEILKRGLLSEKELSAILSIKRTTRPAKIEKKLIKKSQ